MFPFYCQVLALIGVNWRISRSAAQCFRGVGAPVVDRSELSCDKYQHFSLTLLNYPLFFVL